MVIGKVAGVHVADEAITDGKIDVARLKLLARLGYTDYTYVGRVIPIGLEGDWAGREDAARHNRHGLAGGQQQRAREGRHGPV